MFASARNAGKDRRTVHPAIDDPVGYKMTVVVRLWRGDAGKSANTRRKSSNRRLNNVYTKRAKRVVVRDDGRGLDRDAGCSPGQH